MKRGGYKIIDFKDVNILTDGGATVTGIYELLKSRIEKQF